tara:strand:+ start:2217 stop:3860 length:1644 start_codon:yes stop_codon:yes gene_type:complete
MSYSADGKFKNKIIENYEDAPTSVPIFNLKIGDIGNGADWPSISHQDRANKNDFALSQNKDGTTILNASADKSLHFRLGNEDKMVVKNNNVGIGITDPETKLHVDGAVTASDFIDTDGILTASEKLCIGETCVTEDELKQILKNKNNVNTKSGKNTEGKNKNTVSNVDLGNAHVGSQGHGNGWQGISNKNNAKTGHYALIQHDNGTTILNSKAGKNLHFRQGNTDKMVINTAGNVDIKGSLVASNVKIGSQGHGNGWQGISNKNNAKTGQYALIQHDNGTTILNSKAGNGLHFRQGNVDKMVINNAGNVEMRNGMNIQGGRSFFKDAENRGRVRVGAAWGIPGIYSQDNQDVVVGVAPGKTAHIGSNNKFMSVKGDGDVNIKGKLCINDMCLDQYHIKHLLKEYYFTSRFLDPLYGAKLDHKGLLTLDVNYTENLPNDVPNDIILSAKATKNDHYTSMIKCLPYVQNGKTVDYSVYAKGTGQLELFIFQGEGVRRGFFSSKKFNLTNNWTKFTFSRKFTESNSCNVRFDLNNLNNNILITGINLEIK